MKIGIVTGRISKNPAGLERYNIELVKNLPVFDLDNEYIFYVRRGSNVDFLGESQSSNLKIVEVGGGLFWKEIGLFFSPKADIYIFSGLQIPFLFTPKKLVVVVLDLWFKITKPISVREQINFWLLNLSSKKVARRASGIIAISQAAKDDFVRFFRPAKVPIVIYPGFNKICDLKSKEIDNLPAKFFLFVGTIKERKNVLNVIKAFSFFKRDNPDYNLVLAGSFNPQSDYGKKLLDFIQKNNLDGQVYFLGHVDDQELSYLYHTAEAFVFPSILEGFGFPILEAMHCGLPVITSKDSSLGEVAGSDAVLVDHNDPSSIGSALAEVIIKKEKLQIGGREKAQKFSWEKMAKELIFILNKL